MRRSDELSTEPPKTERYRGRLDLLLRDPETLARYEVEIQLGATDESHLVRTIEYWDIERHRYPQYEHTAVIVAEDITSRFLNVISLFNGFIPLIAIQLKAFQVGQASTLVATRVLDAMPLGTDEDDGGEISNRGFWEQKASTASLTLVDSLVDMIHDKVPGIGPSYTKNYIGLAVLGGAARNFVSFNPKKAHVIVEFRITQSDEVSSLIDDNCLNQLSYNKKSGRYPIQVRHDDRENADRKNIIDQLISKAWQAHQSKP